jgi:hypothetical protein
VYLRAWQFTHGEIAFPAIELIASVQTSLLDSDPTLNVRSHAAARDVLQLTSVEASRASTIEWNGGERHFLAASTAIACFIFRLTGGPSSYIEMVHPADFNQSVLRRLPSGKTEVCHRLFAGRLEKGVILRSRVRALLVPGEHDASLASACYAEFAASEPVLTV